MRGFKLNLHVGIYIPNTDKGNISKFKKKLSITSLYKPISWTEVHLKWFNKLLLYKEFVSFLCLVSYISGILDFLLFL